MNIARDVEALVMPGGGSQGERLNAVTGGRADLEGTGASIFRPEDVPMVQLLAQMKCKGDNPDPWAVIDGDTPEAKAANAERLASWMVEMTPRILAETAQVWRREHERAMSSGNEQARKAVLTDARRIATTMAAVSMLDSVGTKSLLVPPTKIVEGTDEQDRPRLVEQRLDAAEHERWLNQEIERDRRQRRQLLTEISRRQEKIREKYPPAEELTDQEREQLRTELQDVYDKIQLRAQLVEEDNPGAGLQFWLKSWIR